MIHDSDRRPSLDDEVRHVVALCQEVQATEYADLPLRTPEVRRTPEEWFRIVRRIPNDRASMRTLRRLRGMSIEAGALPGRSLHRLARSMELQPHVRGIQGISWLHSKSVADVSPHLAWAREFFVENGALAAEMEVAHPGMGFLVGSAQRQRLFHAGRFKPRVGLLLWKRDDVLAWARRHPEFADDGAALAPPTEPRVATAAAPGRAAPTVGIPANLMPQRFWRAPPAVEP